MKLIKLFPNSICKDVFHIVQEYLVRDYLGEPYGEVTQCFSCNSLLPIYKSSCSQREISLESICCGKIFCKENGCYREGHWYYDIKLDNWVKVCYMPEGGTMYAFHVSLGPRELNICPYMRKETDDKARKKKCTIV